MGTSSGPGKLRARSGKTASRLRVAATCPPRAPAAPDEVQWVERRLGGMLDLGPPAFVARPSGVLLYANQAYRALVQALDPARSGAPGEQALAPLEVLREAAKGEAPIEVEHTFTGAGIERPVLGRYWPVRGPEVAVAGLYHDQTEKHDLSTELRLASARFDDIARLTSDWVWEVDENFTFTFVTARITEAVGLPTRFLLGLSLFDCGDFEGFPEANRTQHPKPDSRAPFADVFFRMRGVDDDLRLFKLSGVPVFEDGEGRFLGYRGTATDVSAATEAEARFTEAQARLIHAVETMPQGFALFDTDDRLVLCNSHYEEFLVPGSGMISPGTGYAEILADAEARGMFTGTEAERARFLKAQVERHRMAAQDLEFKLADGRWVLVTSEMTHSGGIIEVWNEITKMKRREAALRTAEEESRRAREQSELANRAKTEFLANMSHELRTPLNAIIGFSEIIKNEMFGPLGNLRYTEYSEDIHASGTHLLGVINDILDFATLDAGKLELAERDIDLRRTAESCLRLLQPRATEAQIALRHDLPDSLPRLRADETKLRQVLLNLLSNSIKFTPAGGKINISAQADPRTGFLIEVSDTGIGIAEEDLPKAFSAFGQVDSALSRKFEGTGLGLPLSKSIVELHGGTLTIDSKVDLGTTVSVLFPSSRIVPAG